MSGYSPSYEFDMSFDDPNSLNASSNVSPHEVNKAYLNQLPSQNVQPMEYNQYPGFDNHGYYVQQHYPRPLSSFNTQFDNKNATFSNVPYGQQFYNQQSESIMYSPEYVKHLEKMNQAMPNVRSSDPTSFEDEPPLLEELGINPDHIIQKTLSVINPIRITDASILQETDLAGPLLLCIIFGSCLLMSGKIHFGYIYSIAVIGCVLMYSLLNLMSDSGVPLGMIITVLGYCLLPVVVLSAVSIILSLRGGLGIFLSFVAVIWASLSASNFFVTALGLCGQQPLVAYPCALLYGLFALITVF